MPGPDGFTVAGRIRAEGDAPIVVVSGESSEEAKVRALGIGADDYLVKPFGKGELLARIAAVMRPVHRSTRGLATGPVTAGWPQPRAPPPPGSPRRGHAGPSPPPPHPLHAGPPARYPATSCGASTQSTRQPRASRPPSGLKWNQAMSLSAIPARRRQPHAEQVTGAP